MVPIGFDVLSKGITITVKKNGRILRRATGLPPFGDFMKVRVSIVSSCEFVCSI